jgi:hypothetical protein
MNTILTRTLVALGSIGFALLAPVSSRAGDVDVPDSVEGFATSSQTNNCCLSTENYVVGSIPEGRPFVGESRNYFSFQIPDFTGDATSASILIPFGQSTLFQSPSIQYTLTSVSVPPSLTQGVLDPTVFNALGTGTIFGTETYTDSTFGTVAITLDAAALAAIDSSRGGTFSLGGRVTSPILFGPNVPDQSIFESTGGTAPQVHLVITHSAPTLAPEIDASQWAAELTLLLGAVAVMRSRRAAPAASRMRGTC